MELEPRHRQEILAIVFLLAGIFVGLTLLPLDITGPLGQGVGGFLWTYLGVGAGLLPVLGFALALAGFDRLPTLDFKRTTVLIGGLIVILPFAIAIVSGVRSVSDFPPNHLDWTGTQKLIGIVPAFLTVAVSSVVGTAGAVIVGLMGLSVVTIYTLDWHPFERMRRGASAGGDEKEVQKSGRGHSCLPHPLPVEKHPHNYWPQYKSRYSFRRPRNQNVDAGPRPGWPAESMGL